MRTQLTPCRLRRTLVQAAVWLFATAVATTLAAADDVADLKANATRFWEARVQGDWKTVYALMPPEEIAQAGTADVFVTYQQTQGPFRYSQATIHDVVVEQDLGWVRVEFVSSPRFYPTVDPTVVDTWQVWQKRESWRPVARGLAGQFPTRPRKVRPAAEETALSTRVDEEWNAHRAGDYAKIYELLDPAYRAATPREEFLARKARYHYLRHTVEWAEVNGDCGRARIAFTRKLNDPTLYKEEPEEVTAFENWLKIDGQWFRDMKPRRGSH